MCHYGYVSFSCFWKILACVRATVHCSLFYFFNLFSNGIIDPKLSLSYFHQTCMTYFVLWISKGDVLQVSIAGNCFSFIVQVLVSNNISWKTGIETPPDIVNCTVWAHLAFSFQLNYDSWCSNHILAYYLVWIVWKLRCSQGFRFWKWVVQVTTQQAVIWD